MQSENAREIIKNAKIYVETIAAPNDGADAEQ